MKLLSIISEYNPFHLGHKFHIKESKKNTQATHTMAIMSGSFVQRGEPAIMDKWTRAEMAILNGIDLIIELPILYSIQTAELFALGAIKILDSLNSVDYLSFGVENDDLYSLKQISHILVKEPIEYKKHLNHFLKKGDSFALAREKALINYTQDSSLKKIINKSNNILAIEYLKALIKLNSDIKPSTVKRKGANYNEKKIVSGFQSATAIRNLIRNKQTQNVIKYIPDNISKKILNYKHFNFLDNYINILNYRLINLTSNDLLKYFDINSDLANRIVNKKKIYQTSEEFVNDIVSKNIPKTRLQRFLIHLLLDINKEEIMKSFNINNEFIRVLASNEKGFEIINQIKENSNIHIVNNKKDADLLNKDNINFFLDREQIATNIYFLNSTNDNINLDYKTSPYILAKK